MNQKLPASATSAEHAGAQRKTNCGLSFTLQMIGKITAATINCPISTPELNASNGIATALPCSPTPISRSALAKPNPCTNPNPNVSHTRCPMPLSRRTIFSIATYTIVAAINGSTMRLEKFTNPSVASARLIECATVNAVITLMNEDTFLHPMSSANKKANDHTPSKYV